MSVQLDQGLDRRTVGAYLNDAAFHLKLAERALERVEREFSGRTRRAVRRRVKAIAEQRREVMLAMHRAGINHRRDGTSGHKRKAKRWH